MPLEMPVEDLRRDLVGCVVMHNNKPVYVTAVGARGIVAFRDLGTQKEDQEMFTLEGFSNPVRRIGFVNIMGSVLYITRVPVRKYYMGLSVGGGRSGNLKIQYLDNVNYPQDANNTITRAKSLCIPELGQAIMNKYPKFTEAMQQVAEFGGACAFDKQFAVCAKGYIIYKTQRVGKAKLNAKTFQDIQWNEGCEHLSILLDNNHEKTVRDFAPKTC